MTKYFLNNEEYTLDEITSAAEQSGLDIDAYIEEYNIEVREEEEMPANLEGTVFEKEPDSDIITFDEFEQKNQENIQEEVEQPKTGRTAKELMQDDMATIGISSAANSQDLNAQGEQFLYNTIEEDEEGLLNLYTTGKKIPKNVWTNSTDEDILEQPWYKVLRHHPDFVGKTTLAGLIDLQARRNKIKENKNKRKFEKEEFEELVL